MAVNMVKLKVFVRRCVGDLRAAIYPGRVSIGEKLGLYKALAEGHPKLSRARTRALPLKEGDAAFEIVPARLSKIALP